MIRCLSAGLKHALEDSSSIPMSSPVFPKFNGTLAQADLACGYTAPLALDHHGPTAIPPRDGARL